MKNSLRVIEILCLALSLLLFGFFLLEFYPAVHSQNPLEITKEEYDPTLLRIDDTKKALDYCDSLSYVKSAGLSSPDHDSLFANMATLFVRERFFHGGAEYGIGNNFMALFLQPLLFRYSVTEIVSIDDILKKPQAICGQQARVFAELLIQKNIPVRKVLFNHAEYGQHYAVEVYYQGNWHFFDPDKEPEYEIAGKYDRPSLEILNKNPEVLQALYQKQDTKMIIEVFKTGKIYQFDKQEGPHLLLYQRVTHVLSFCSWIIFAVLFVWVRRINRSYKEE